MINDDNHIHSSDAPGMASIVSPGQAGKERQLGRENGREEEDIE